MGPYCEESSVSPRRQWRAKQGQKTLKISFAFDKVYWSQVAVTGLQLEEIASRRPTGRQL